MKLFAQESYQKHEALATRIRREVRILIIVGSVLEKSVGIFEFRQTGTQNWPPILK